MVNQPVKPFHRFLIIWAGQLLSRIGSGVSAFVLGIHILERTGNTTGFSMFLLAAFLPPVVLMPIGGVIVDRHNRRLLMIAGDIGSAAGMLIVIGALVWSKDQLWPLFAGVSLSSIFTALHAPAFKASITDLLDETDFARVGGLIQLAEASRYLIAPAIGALLMTRIRLSTIMFFDMLSFIVAALAILSVHWQQASLSEAGLKFRQGSFQTDLNEGIHYLKQSRTLLSLLGITTAITFLTGVLQVLFSPIVLAVSSPQDLGIIQSIAASGMLISGFFISLISRTENQKQVLTVSLGASGMCYFLIGLVTGPVAITIAAFGFFFTLPLVNTSLEVLFRQNIEHGKQGRIWSLVSFITQTGMLAALACSGYLADRVFNPLLTSEGSLSGSLGRFIGTGPVRGSGLMVMFAGFIIAALGCVLAISSSKQVDMESINEKVSDKKGRLVG